MIPFSRIAQLVETYIPCCEMHLRSLLIFNICAKPHGIVLNILHSDGPCGEWTNSLLLTERKRLTMPIFNNLITRCTVETKYPQWMHKYDTTSNLNSLIVIYAHGFDTTASQHHGYSTDQAIPFVIFCSSRKTSPDSLIDINTQTRCNDQRCRAPMFIGLQEL